MYILFRPLMVVSFQIYCINCAPKPRYLLFHSKSFGTIDTLSNAQTVRLWLEKALGQESQILKASFYWCIDQSQIK